MQLKKAVDLKKCTFQALFVSHRHNNMRMRSFVCEQCQPSMQPPHTMSHIRGSESLLVARQAPPHHSCQGNACMQRQLEKWRSMLGVGGSNRGLVVVVVVVGEEPDKFKAAASPNMVMVVVVVVCLCVCLVNWCTCVDSDKAGGRVGSVKVGWKWMCV